MIHGGFLFWLILEIVAPIVGFFILYWIIRLAVRHGIEDVQRRNLTRAREDIAWDPQRT